MTQWVRSEASWPSPKITMFLTSQRLGTLITYLSSSANDPLERHRMLPWSPLFLYLFAWNYLTIHIQKASKLVLVYATLCHRWMLKIIWKHFQDFLLWGAGSQFMYAWIFNYTVPSGIHLLEREVTCSFKLYLESFAIAVAGVALGIRI